MSIAFGRSRRRTTGFGSALLATPTGGVGLAGVSILVLIALVAPHFWSDLAQTVHVTSANQGPSAVHRLGTDGLGRDVLARGLVALRLSLVMAVSATSIAAVVGTVIGASIGLLTAGTLRDLLLRSVESSLAFPALLVAILVVSIVGPGAGGAILAIGIAVVPQYVWIVSTLTLSVAGREYISAARLQGLSRARLLYRHLLPNVAEPLVVTTSVVVATSLVWLSALSFLGLGVQAPRFDLGSMLNDGLKALYVNPAAALVPAAGIVFAGITFGFLGDGLSQALNPVFRTMRRRRRKAKDLSSVAVQADTPDTPQTCLPDTQPTVDYTCRETSPPLVAVRDLTIDLSSHQQTLRIVDGISFAVKPGELLGLVGESGSGKTLTALALAGLTPPAATVAGDIRWNGQSLISLSRRVIRKILSQELAMVFQDPNASLNPAIRVGNQITESIRVHGQASRKSARELAIGKLEAVGMPGAPQQLAAYPHQLSGGMRQRAIIAMGLMISPTLIIADEPTTALDVTIQKQVIAVLKAINAKFGTAMVFISHDLPLVAELCSRVIVMYSGRIVETGSAEQLVHDAKHPYTRALLAAVPDMATERNAPLTVIKGQPPAFDQMPPGCCFAPRCSLAHSRCGVAPPLISRGDRQVACWAAEDRA